MPRVGGNEGAKGVSSAVNYIKGYRIRREQVA